MCKHCIFNSEESSYRTTGIVLITISLVISDVYNISIAITALRSCKLLTPESATKDCANNITCRTIPQTRRLPNVVLQHDTCTLTNLLAALHHLMIVAYHHLHAAHPVLERFLKSVQCSIVIAIDFFVREVEAGGLSKLLSVGYVFCCCTESCSEHIPIFCSGHTIPCSQ